MFLFRGRYTQALRLKYNVLLLLMEFRIDVLKTYAEKTQLGFETKSRNGKNSETLNPTERQN